MKNEPDERIIAICDKIISYLREFYYSEFWDKYDTMIQTGDGMTSEECEYWVSVFEKDFEEFKNYGLQYFAD